MIKKIDAFENANLDREPAAQNINPELFRAYSASKRNGNDLIDFGEPFMDIKDIEKIIENCKLYGVTEFTISSSFSNLTGILYSFEKYGFYIKGMTKIKTIEGISIPAIKLERA